MQKANSQGASAPLVRGCHVQTVILIHITDALSPKNAQGLTRYNLAKAQHIL